MATGSWAGYMRDLGCQNLKASFVMAQVSFVRMVSEAAGIPN